MKSRGREGFTLVELLAAVGIGAGTAVALAGLSWSLTILSKSAWLWAMRGRPNMGQAGSSGWQAIRTPTASHTGMTASRKYL